MVNKSTSGRLLRQFREIGRVADRPRSDRPRHTTPLEDRFIVTSSRCKRFMSSGQLLQRVRNATGTTISDTTARRHLRSASLLGRRSYFGVSLTLRHWVERLASAQSSQVDETAMT